MQQVGPFLKAHAAAERHPPHTQRPSRFPAPLPADVLLSSATVRESLMLAALLKLPRSMRRADKVARVDAVLKELASAWDGGTAHRGLVGVGGGGGAGGDCGGQRARGTRALALAAGPALLPPLLRMRVRGSPPQPPSPDN